MLIKEVCSLCGLTRKAVEYYEQQCFIKPQVLDNGYRNYLEKEIAVLKEISLLRKCDIGIQDIRVILDSQDKSVALARYKHLNELKIQKLKMAHDCIDGLIRKYDIDKGLHCLLKFDEEGFTVQEKLVLAFPGNYGIYLSLHFGRFLRDSILKEEQRVAYNNVITYLDNAAVHIPDELNVYLQRAIQTTENGGVEKFEEDMNNAMEEAIHSPESIFKNSGIQEYIVYRISEEFRQSPEGMMVDLMTEFQKNSGYQDVFLTNLKILSPAYKEYCDGLETANALFFERYPQAEEIFGLK